MSNADKPVYPVLDKLVTDGVDQGLELKDSGLTKREYFAAHADIPWDAVIGMLEKKFPSGTKITAHDLIAYRASLKILEADELLKQLEK